jgi:hypothetical protein
MAIPAPEPEPPSDALVLHSEAKSGWHKVSKKPERKPREPRKKAPPPEPAPVAPVQLPPQPNLPSWASWKREYLQLCLLSTSNMSRPSSQSNIPPSASQLDPSRPSPRAIRYAFIPFIISRTYSLQVLPLPLHTRQHSLKFLHHHH